MPRFARHLNLMVVFAFAAMLPACGGGGGGGSTTPLPPGTGRQISGAAASSQYDNLVVSDGAVEYYRLDETSGSVAADASGHSADAAYVGVPGADYQLGQSPGPFAQESQGWFQNLGTTASHGVAAPAVTAATTNSSWTLEAWLKLPALPSAARYATTNMTIAGSSGQNRLMVRSNGTLVYQSVSGSSLASATALQPGTLYHVVLRSDLSAGTYGTVSLTINGVKDANTLAYTRTTYRQGMVSPYYWGQYDTSAYYKWNGYLGRVAYYTTALSDAAILNHYNQGLAAPTPTPAPTPTATLPADPATATPSPVPTTSATPAAVITAPSGVSYFSAQISAVSSTQIWVYARSGCGAYHFNVNSSTVYFNGPPSVGQWAVFVGVNKPCSLSFTATSASLSASAATTTTLSGVVGQATPYGFTLNTAANAAVPIVLQSGTAIFGSTLTPGATVSVTGVGSPGVSVVATQVAVAAPTPDPSIVPTPTPGPIAMQHIMMGGFIYGYGGTPSTVPLSSITPWITWAMTDQLHAALLRSAGLKVTAYTLFWRNHTTDNPILGYTDLAPGGAHAAAEAADCNGNALYDSSYGGGYASDARTSAALGHAQLVVNNRISQFGSNYDAIFADDTGSFTGMTPPCNYNEQAYDAAVNAVHTALGVPLWVNALGAKSPQYAPSLTTPSNVVGGMCELCYGMDIFGSDTLDTAKNWINVENTEIATIANHKLFWDYARVSGDPSTEIGLRTYIYASLLLSFDPAYVMFQENFRTPSGFPVMPEAGLVVQNPLTTASDVSGYLAPGGAYFREFGGCYYRGAFVNKCAVVINPSTTATVPVPSTSYFHSMALSGSDVLDGGTINFTGPQVTQLAPASAAILFP
jgi:Concanavalin A-like lectin/glucanases superfamily